MDINERLHNNSKWYDQITHLQKQNRLLYNNSIFDKPEKDTKMISVATPALNYPHQFTMTSKIFYTICMGVV